MPAELPKSYYEKFAANANRWRLLLPSKRQRHSSDDWPPSRMMEEMANNLLAGAEFFLAVTMARWANRFGLFLSSPSSLIRVILLLLFLVCSLKYNRSLGGSCPHNPSKRVTISQIPVYWEAPINNGYSVQLHRRLHVHSTMHITSISWRWNGSLDWLTRTGSKRSFIRKHA